jgi:hypothetical protein
VIDTLATITDAFDVAADGRVSARYECLTGGLHRADEIADDRDQAQV